MDEAPHRVYIASPGGNALAACLRHHTTAVVFSPRRLLLAAHLAAHARLLFLQGGARYEAFVLLVCVVLESWVGACVLSASRSATATLGLDKYYNSSTIAVDT